MEASAANLSFYPEINSYIAEVVQQFNSIDDERRAQLQKLALYIKSKSTANEDVKIVYICTHNSRRSHMSQLWGMIAANYYGVQGVSTYSGGTETTAFNPRSVACLQRAGFEIEQKTEGENPIFAVTYADGVPAVESFSKVYTHESNPKENFVAVMTCSHADKNCPSVDGASMRIALPYEDPKAADNTPEESAVYDERCRQIAIEEFFLFSQVK
ncbi:MAG: protein-tyrosine-phosphatase [Cryomorphaceae bacterium]|nr:protein-tyrosine-phosphatase [Cryomorphaceae bacterium]